MSQPLLPAGIAGEALPCLLCALKYLFKAPLPIEDAAALDGHKTIHKSLPSGCHGFVSIGFSVLRLVSV